MKIDLEYIESRKRSVKWNWKTVLIITVPLTMIMIVTALNPEPESDDNITLSMAIFGPIMMVSMYYSIWWLIKKVKWAKELEIIIESILREIDGVDEMKEFSFYSEIKQPKNRRVQKISKELRLVIVGSFLLVSFCILLAAIVVASNYANPQTIIVIGIPIFSLFLLFSSIVALYTGVIDSEGLVKILPIGSKLLSVSKKNNVE